MALKSKLLKILLISILLYSLLKNPKIKVKNGGEYVWKIALYIIIL